MRPSQALLVAIPVFVLTLSAARDAPAQPPPPPAQPPPPPPPQSQTPSPPLQPPPFQPHPLQPRPSQPPLVQWAPPPAASPVWSRAQPPEKLPGVSAKGIPLAQRGGVRVDLAGFRAVGTNYYAFVGNDAPISTVDVVVQFPLRDHTFLDAILPIGFVAIGNPTFGAHHVARVRERVWISAGGLAAFPLVKVRGYDLISATRGLWDGFSFSRNVFSVVGRLGVEGHVGPVQIRGQLDPILGIPTDVDGNAHFTLQHACEVQLGHMIGGGLRYQGVLFATRSNPWGSSNPWYLPSSPSHDRYQGALEPFLALRRQILSFRVGFVIPLDKPLGPPFVGGWGARASIGAHID